MFHGLTNRILYTAHRIETQFVHDDGTMKTVLGTGFFIMNIRSELCFVTNRHVLELAYKHSKYIRFRINSISVHSIEPTGDAPMVLLLAPDNRIVFSPTYANDIACIVSPRVIAATEAKIDCFIEHSLLATRDEFETSLSVCDFIAFPGYPPWYDRRGGRPILRTGTIASDPRHNYSWTEEDKGDCLAYEAFSYGGSSGSPVFAVQKGPKPGPPIVFSGFRDLRMIGINAGHLPSMDGHSGISYLYKSYAILDLIDHPQAETV